MNHAISYHKQTSTCIHCKTEDIKKFGLTSLGYHQYRCYDCKRSFNERTNTQFNFTEYPTDIIMLVVRWHINYKLSLRDLVEMFHERGIVFSHESVRGWVKKFGPILIEKLRKRRKNKVGVSWYVDETIIKVKGKKCYLYRAIDRDGNLVDSMLSKKRDMKASKQFFKSAKNVCNIKPDR